LLLLVAVIRQERLLLIRAVPADREKDGKIGAMFVKKCEAV
jgi:hypothetical protein